MLRFSKKVLLLCMFNIIFILLLVFFLHKSAKGKNTMAMKIHEDRFPSKYSDLMEKTLKLFYDTVQQRIKICLLEPRILFNLISIEDRQKLKRIGFELDVYKGVNNVYSLAVLERDAAVLNDIALNTVLKAKGFKHWAIKSHGSKAAKQFNKKTSQDNSRTTHFLYIRGTVILHVVVLYKRGNYFWQEKVSVLPPKIAELQNYEKYLYMKEDSTYSRFEFILDPSKDGWNTIYIPSDIPKFLSQLQTARFIPCSKNSSTAVNKNQFNDDQPPLWLFERTAKEVIKKLEFLMDPTLTQFWLASGTLLGWYRDCGIIPYTSDMDFAAWANSISDDFIAKFKTSKDIELLNMLGKVSKDLEFWLRFKWLQVDLFFVYKGEGDTFYFGGHRPWLGYSFKYVLPEFSLCSADLLGQRVTVPCNAEDIIKAEYGNNWRNPEQEWNYELSAKNVFGRRYWDEEEKKNFKLFSSQRKLRNQSTGS